MTVRNALVGIALSITASSAFAQVTYDFTGVVTSSTILSLDGGTTPTPISGTFTFDYAASIPFFSVGTPGDQNNYWHAEDFGGTSSLGHPTPTANVFSETLSTGGFFFTTAPISSYESDSLLQGTPYAVATNGMSQLFAYTDNTDSSGNSFVGGVVWNGVGTANAFNTMGLPIYGGHDIGYFDTESLALGYNTTQFVITSITPASMVAAVPEPSTYFAMLVGLGMLAFSGLRRKRAG